MQKNRIDRISEINKERVLTFSFNGKKMQGYQGDTLASALLANDIKIVGRSFKIYDVNNGIARRSWARNKEAIFAIEREMERTPNLKVTVPKLVDENVLNNLDF